MTVNLHRSAVRGKSKVEPTQFFLSSLKNLNDSFVCKSKLHTRALGYYRATTAIDSFEKKKNFLVIRRTINLFPNY